MILVRTMTLADLPLAMRLKSQAGWNQQEADWRRFLDMQPDGCFVAECAGVAVATTVACVFDRVAWLAMVLVDAAYRGRFSTLVSGSRYRLSDQLATFGETRSVTRALKLANGKEARSVEEFRGS